MPLSEFLPPTRGKFNSGQPKTGNSVPDLPASVPDSEFMELLWGNGQIVMQGQSSRPKKSHVPTFSTHSTKLQGKEGRDAVPPRISRFAAFDSDSNDFSPADISAELEPNAQDDDAPWLNYPIDDYCLEFLSEFPASNTNASSVQTPVDKGSNGFSQVVRDSHNVDQNALEKIVPGNPDSGRNRTVQFPQMSQQWTGSVPSSKSRASDFVTGTGTLNGHSSTWDLPNAKLHGQDLPSPKLPPALPPPASGSSGFFNFSHFTRPVSLLKANFQSLDRLNSGDKTATAASTSAMESTGIESSGVLKNISPGQFAPVSGAGEPKSTSHPPKEHASINRLEALNWEDGSRDKNVTTIKNMQPADHVHVHGSVFTTNLPGVRHEIDKGSEPVLASSSVCSGNGAGTMSSDSKHRVKRKIQGEESGYQSEDLDDESTVVKKHVMPRGTPTKRSRAAEVHNLSERRRRDRINEKMRALQELIPNCNKVDKASMLDEAIEYLKTLQLQLQIMSMGNGLCMPPMMLPPGMQHLRAPHMVHFSPMGIGLGMGFGMGMIDINGSPLVPVPPMPGPQFPCSSIPGNPGLPGMAGPSSLQVYGVPGQSHPMPFSHVRPYVHLPMYSTRVNSMPEVSETAAAPTKVAEMDSCASLNDQKVHKSNSETGHRAEIDDQHTQISTQDTKECFEEPSDAQIKNHASHSSDGAINSTSANGNSSAGTSRQKNHFGYSQLFVFIQLLVLLIHSISGNFLLQVVV